MTQDLMAVVELHPEHCIRERLDDRTLDLDYVVFTRHRRIRPILWAEEGY
jgi:hypothetical protein